MRLAVLALAAMTVLAGCGGPSGKDEETGAIATAPTPTFDADTGAVQGTVITDESVPVAGAEVALLQTEFRTLSDEAGAFTINNVPPGTYTLTAIKLGFNADAKSVTVAAGEILPATILLAAIPIEEAFLQTDINTGHLDWGIRIVPQVGGYAGGDLAHDFETDGRTDAMGGFLVEMTWQDTQALAGGMRLGVEVIEEDNEGDYTFCVLDSRPPGRCDGTGNVTKVLENGHDDCPPEQCHLQWRGFTSTRYTGLPVDFGIMLDQDCTVYTSIFFHGPMPDAYSGMPDG